jgi:hypothetical protein
MQDAALSFSSAASFRPVLTAENKTRKSHHKVTKGTEESFTGRTGRPGRKAPCCGRHVQMPIRPKAEKKGHSHHRDHREHRGKKAKS